MEKFVVSTDSTCDLSAAELKQWNIPCAPLTFTIEEKNGEMHSYLDNFQTEEEYVAFYNRLRSGAFSRTAKLNYQAHLDFFTPLAARGVKQLLHFTISTGLSSTKEIAERAAAEVKKHYPDFSVTVVDPLTATVGQGALVMLAKKCAMQGWELEQTYHYINGLRLKIQHFIVADDLNYLRRGGRVSAASAAIGGLLNVKPMLTFDNLGRLTVLEKNRGMIKSVESMLSKPLTIPIDRSLNLVYIVHTGNFAMAQKLEKEFVARYGIQPHVSLMGPVIGSHLGPNGIGYGYFSTVERNKPQD